MSGALISFASPDDLAAIMAIQQATDENDWSEKSFAEYIANQQCWVAKKESAVAGFAVFSHVLDEAELLNIAVDPNFQRQGIAGFLYHTAIEALRKVGVSQCFLEVAKANSKAQQFYVKLGFEQIAIRKNYYQRPHGIDDAIVMRVAL